MPHEFIAPNACDAMALERLSHATVRVHWTDEPYRCDLRAGLEVFAVPNGWVDLHVLWIDGYIEVHRLERGDVFDAGEEEEHLAHPVGEPRVAVVERAGSV